MRKLTIVITAALAAALAVCMIAGCSSQSSSSSAAAQTQEEIIAELKAAIANQPEFKSVTLTEDTKSTFKDVAETEESASGEAASSEAASSEAASSEAASSEAASDEAASSEAASDEAASSEAASSEAASSESAAAEEAAEANTIVSKSVYQFDASGEALKTCLTYEIEDIRLQYYSDGDKAVCVTDGPVYSGTTEQFDQSQFAGFEAYFAETVGDLNTYIDCAETVGKDQQGDITIYTVTLDPEKYMASDEILTIMKEAGDPVLSAVYAFGFDKDGRLVSVHEVIDYSISSTDVTYTLSDFDSTVIDPMPEADKTYEEMESDVSAKFEALAAELDATSEYEDDAK